MPLPKNIKYILIHTSDSKWGSVDVIRQWHTDPPPKGRGWSDIGYHYVITNGFLTYNALMTNKRDSKQDGQVHTGRPLHLNGAHTVGYNHNSIGICLVGAGGKYTQNQIQALMQFVTQLCTGFKVPVENVLGHYETPNGKSQHKTCPDIDMVKFRQELAKSLAK